MSGKGRFNDDISRRMCFGHWSPEAKECKIDSIYLVCRRFTMQRQAVAGGAVIVKDEKILKNRGKTG